MTQYTTGTPRTPLAVLIAVILIGSVVPVGAVVLSDPTGIIHGRAPTATGDLYALMPDGTTVVTNNVIVSQTATPNQFTPSMVTTGITPLDADGDTGLTSDMSSATLVWKDDQGAVLSGTPLITSLVSNYPSKTMTLEVHAPVTTSSTTGLPTTSGRVDFVTAYMVKVPPAPITMPATVKLASQYTTWAVSSGFPKTAFPGASYTLWMNGLTTSTNTQYTYESTQPWVTVTTGGVVSFVSMPPSASKTAKIFATRNDGVVYTLNVAPIKWYASGNSVNDTSIPNYTVALADCETKGGTIPKVSELGSNSVSRSPGKMVDEWGGVLGQRSYTRLGSPIWHMLSDTYQNRSDRKIPVAIHDGSVDASKIGYFETGEFNVKGIFALCSIPII